MAAAREAVRRVTFRAFSVLRVIVSGVGLATNGYNVKTTLRSVFIFFHNERAFHHTLAITTVVA